MKFYDALYWFRPFAFIVLVCDTQISPSPAFYMPWHLHYLLFVGAEVNVSISAGDAFSPTFNNTNGI